MNKENQLKCDILKHVYNKLSLTRERINAIATLPIINLVLLVCSSRLVDPEQRIQPRGLLEQVFLRYSL
jgi:hypothetical protein